MLAPAALTVAVRTPVAPAEATPTSAAEASASRVLLVLGESASQRSVMLDGGVVNFTGRVAPTGNVRVRVSSGSAFADGAGRLNRNAGQGRWNGQSAGSRCTGYWTAERR